MKNLNTQQQFIYSEIKILAWGASVQHANVYKSDIPAAKRDRLAFRREILNFIEKEIIPMYKDGCSENRHIANIQEIVKFGTKCGKNILGPDGYKFGIAQKLLNLWLKYLWCLRYIVEPPHCPVDRIVLAETALGGKLNWTEIKNESEYKKAIKAIRDVAYQDQLSLPQWELQFYSRR